MDTDMEWPMQTISAEEIVQSREEHDRFVAELLTAAKNGDVTHVTDILDDEIAIESGINANSYDNDDTTPLQVASANGHTSVIELLISRGADPLLCNQFGWTPLMHAAYHGQVEAVECLIKAGVNVNSRSFLENCPLKLAAREGHAKVVTILLDHGCLLETYMCSAFSMSCDYNLTPLMVATVNKQDEIVRIMLERGADANATMRPTGMSVLMLSVLFAELTTVQLLLNRGADPETTNVLGQTAYDLAVAANKRDILALLEPLMKNKSDSSTCAPATSGIIEAIYEGNKSMVENLLKADPALVDFVNPDDGSTPLIVASMLGRLDIVTLLVGQGAALNHQDKKAGWTALMQATYHGKPHVAKYLIHQGADVNMKSYDGYTAFDLAAVVQSSDDGGLLSLLAYRIAEQNVTKTHKSRHFLAFLFRHNRNNGMDTRKLSTPSKPMNWWRKFKSRFRRGVTTVRRSASVANFHSTLRTRSSLSGHEMTAIGEGSKSLKNSLFYSCDDLLRVQTLRRSSLDSSIIHRVTASTNQSQAAKLAATMAPRHPPTVASNGCSLSPIPPFCAPPFFTVDMSKVKAPSVIVTSTDIGKISRPPSSIASVSTIAASSTLTLNLTRSPGTTISKNPASSSGSSDQEKLHGSSTGSPPNSEYSIIAKTSSEYSSSCNDEPSVASINAARLGTGKATPPRVPLPKKASNALGQVPLPKKASSACDLSFLLGRTTTPSQPSVSTSSSGSTTANTNMLGANYRMKRPQALYITSNNGGGSAFPGGRKPRANRALRRPHSYHDAAVEGGMAAYGMPFQGVGRKPKLGAPPPLNIGRPCSYQDPAVVNSSQTLNDLPITPTRKSFNFFASDLPSSFQSKCSSTPHLAASLSNSSGRSSVVTPIRRPSQYATSPTNFVSHGPMFFPSMTRDGKDHLQHTLWQLGLEKYANVFREQEVDMETFLTLTDSDLKDLGIMDAANRNEILVVVRTLNFCFQNQRRHMNEVREVHNEREDEIAAE